MPTISWLHVSDWHQKGNEFDRTVIRDALLADLRQREAISPDLKTVNFVVFSGDLSYSGATEDLEAAWAQLIDPIIKILDISPSKVFLVPGNHDLDRTVVEDLLPSGLQKPLKGPEEVNRWISESRRLQKALEPFGSYCNFVTKYTGMPNPAFGRLYT